MHDSPTFELLDISPLPVEQGVPGLDPLVPLVTKLDNPIDESPKKGKFEMHIPDTEEGKGVKSSMFLYSHIKIMMIVSCVIFKMVSNVVRPPDSNSNYSKLIIFLGMHPIFCV